MNCTEFEIAAECAVESRSSLVPAAIEHISACTECRRSWELQQQLNAVINAWRTVQPSAGFADVVFAELTIPDGVRGQELSKEKALRDENWDFADTWDERPRSPSSAFVENRTDAIALAGRDSGLDCRTTTSVDQKNRSGAFPIAAAAVCLAVAALFTTRFGRDSADELTNAPQQQTTSVAKTDVPPDLSSTLTEVFSDLKTEYHEMASETKAMAREMVISLPHRVDTQAAPDSENVELLPNSDDMVRMLEPIGSRVESAFGFLWNTIPSKLPAG